eukprot:scaffold255676_cov19-Tisochrysis_lutea.AAC.1
MARGATALLPAALPTLARVAPSSRLSPRALPSPLACSMRRAHRLHSSSRMRFCPSPQPEPTAARS